MAITDATDAAPRCRGAGSAPAAASPLMANVLATVAATR